MLGLALPVVSDQQRWFKFWCTAPYDDHLQRLTVPDRWAWVVLGAYTKAHGTRGTVLLSPSNAALAGAMGIPVTALVTTLARLPHIQVSKNHHDDVTVTWDNWPKYQEDTTQAARQRTSRAKKRREKEEKKSSTEGTTAPPLPPVDKSLGPAHLPPEIHALMNPAKTDDALWKKLRTKGPAAKQP